MTNSKRRVVVVGAGNAALSAAIASAQEGAEVVVLEKAGEAERGGNTYFTGGGFRFPYEGIETIQDLLKRQPKLRIIAMSGGGRGNANDYLPLAKLLGARRTLAKPFTLEELTATVTAVLAEP